MRLSETHEQIRDTTRRFAQEVIRPLAEELDREERFPAEIYKQMGELGLFGITVPEEFGGAGLDVTAYALVMEELSRGYASVADQCGLLELVGTLLSVHGTDEQRAKYMEPLLRAEMRPRILHHRIGRGYRRVRHPHHRDAHRRRLGTQRREALDSQRAGRRPRLRARAHRPVAPASAA